ncbi:Small conductance mechanosensitive ion channel,MscS family [Lactococcus lactis subsp. lactis A12]|uniref:Small conductance mechanosensitive ion channel,MscS family n=1 Tax=Lactococcus lactis subsp. lactis A12 TaxID=1137134 RepID=S6FIA8_LACLL|nr:Small conductance mechanosensitive ion channel,MscS family [Lactococcus lactis subsp. lactis A12]
MNLLKTNWEDFGLFLLDKAITILLISILFLFSIKLALVSLNAYLKIIVSKNGRILREF